MSWLLVLGSLFFIAILVIDTNETTSEGQYLAEGDKHAVVYLCQWR